jgi:heme ABC exporter ATP-binding subunit CcmA
LKAVQGFQISKGYHHFQVLREVSFEVEEGECFALFGPNGAGKTTLLKILSTLQRPTSGTFQMMGLDGVKDRDKVRNLFLLVGHGSYLYNELDALENINFSLALRGISRTDQEVKKALDRVDIGPFARFKVRAFSEGMKKRLAMAKTILVHPKVLLLDEPYSALDESGMGLVNQFMKDITEQGTAILMTTHNRTKTAEVAHRAACLQQGVMKEIAVQELVEAHELF